MKISLFVLLLLTVSWSHAAETGDKRYSMCGVAGYYDGGNNRFLSDIAMRVVEKNHLNSDSECAQAFKAGKDLGVKFSKPGRIKNEDESEIINDATHFGNLIYDAILSRVKFD